MGALSAASPVWHLPVAFLKSVGSIAFGLLLFLFPDGRFVPHWTRFVALAWILWQLPKYWFPRWTDSDPGSPFIWVALSVWTVALGAAVYAQGYRYLRVSGTMQRQQIKWVVFGISAGLAGFLGTNVAVSALAPVPDSPAAVLVHLAGHTVSYAAMFLIPISIGIAILRYHLFDIDLIIRRTLVYGALTASVVGLYVLVVGGLGVMLQVRGNLLVSILAAGLVAVLFQPLRERLQRGVNRLLYGERDDPYAVLSRLGSRLESRLAPEAVLPAVTRTLQEALRLPYAEIQLKRKEGFETAAAAGSPVENTIDAARALMRKDPDAAEELLLDLKADAQNAVTDIRRLVYGLRPPALDDLGLLGALRETAAQYGANGLGVSVEVSEKLPPLSAAVEVAAYRIAQEALTNVARHAAARSARVSLALDEGDVLCVEVSDDGVGMPDQETSHSGVGLTSMRERATELGGSLAVEALPGGGTRVRARLPLPEEG